MLPQQRVLLLILVFDNYNITTLRILLFSLLLVPLVLAILYKGTVQVLVTVTGLALNVVKCNLICHINIRTVLIVFVTKNWLYI